MLNDNHQVSTCSKPTSFASATVSSSKVLYCFVFATLSARYLPVLRPVCALAIVCFKNFSFQISDVLNLIISVENNDMIPLVRVGENNANLIKRVMDAGAYGVIIPNVTSTDEVKAAINAVKYPLEGTRGVGLYRAQKYGKSFNEYLKWLKNESIIIIQIEQVLGNSIDIIRQEMIQKMVLSPDRRRGIQRMPSVSYTHLTLPTKRIV